MELKYKIINNKYLNIKHVLKLHFEISDKLLTKLKKHQKIMLNGNLSYVTTPVKIGDLVTINLDFDEQSENILPIKMNLNIIYEDDYLLILNKDAGVSVHPSILHYTDSLSNGVQYYFETQNIKRKIRPVNRLDKDTSGIIIFSKSEYIQECLIRQMKNKNFKKEYLAILEGHLEKNFGTINAPISRNPNSIIEREINSNGEISITHFKLIKNFEILDSLKLNQKLSLVKFQLETGRTHQIRVHSKYIGHSILGDFLYGKRSDLIQRQALHAYKISFIHPITKQTMNFQIDLPLDMKILLSNIEQT